MSNIDLPRNENGDYIDLYAKFYGNNEALMQAYAKKIKETYKVDSFQIKTESHGVLRFYRDRFTVSIDDINKNMLSYDIFEENIEYLGNKITGTIQIDRIKRIFLIQIFYQDDRVAIERRGLATEIWKNAIEIMEKIGIEDYRGYTIETMVDVATKHLLDKYGNPFNPDR